MSNNNEFEKYNGAKKNANQINLILGILGFIFAISVMYFTVNEKKNKETIEVINKKSNDFKSINKKKDTNILEEKLFTNEEETVNKEISDIGEKIDDYIKFNPFCIKDLNTNYYWYIAPDRNFNYEEAKNFALTINERKLNWRIPTFDEIKSLYNSNYSAGEGFYINNKYYPAKIHNVFSSIGSGSWFWVSDINNNITKAYAINLHEGIKTNFDSQNPKYPAHLLLVSK